MKIVLNREEVRQFRELSKTMCDIADERVEGFLDNFKITKKAYLVSMVSGELTVEVREEFTTELLELINGVTSESAPAIKAIIGLIKTLVPTQMKYAEKFDDLFNRYDDREDLMESVREVSRKNPWNVVSVKSEKVELLNLNKEAI